MARWAQNRIELPAPVKTGGMPLMEALSKRATDRADGPRALAGRHNSCPNLLWAAWGINRPDGRRTAPSALNRQEIDIYLIGRRDAYRYDAAEQRTGRAWPEGDFRRDVNSQDYTKTCDWILVYVADYSKMAGGSDSDRAVTAGIDAGLIAQNVYLYGASEGLAVVVHMSINRDVIARALKLGASQHIVLAQSVGLPRQPMIPREKLLETLKRHWGYERFRPLQLETIEDGVRRTGHARADAHRQAASRSSIRYPPWRSEGVCVVVTPLIALMKDQIDRLRSQPDSGRGRSTRACRRATSTAFWTTACTADVKFLYIAPERIDSEHVPDPFRENDACRCWPSTRRTASPNGATTSGPPI